MNFRKKLPHSSLMGSLVKNHVFGIIQMKRAPSKKSSSNLLMTQKDMAAETLLSEVVLRVLGSQCQKAAPRSSR